MDSTGGGVLKNAGKTLFYHTNGTGRDSYIVNGSGGLCSTQQTNIQPKVGSMNIKKPYRSSLPVIHSRTLNYHSNGTGRDAYIGVSSGGLMSDTNAGQFKNSFYNTLRSYDSTRNSQDWSSGASKGFGTRKGSLSPRSKEGLITFKQPVP